MLDGSSVSASGQEGGGRILVGGGLQGKDPTVPNARAVYMAKGARARADAGSSGDGGQVILWSDEATRVYGTLSARAGSQGGDGGFIETSGGWLDARPREVRTDAPKGRPGQWLLEPNDISISDASVSDANISAGPDFTTTDDSATIDMSTIAAAHAAGNNVTISTGTSGANSQPVDIVMEGDLDVDPPGSAASCGWLLDEPTASLDPHAKRDVETLIADFGDETPAPGRLPPTLVFASHNLGQVKRLASRVVYMEQGRVLADLPVQQFFDQSLLEERLPQASAFVKGETT